MPGTAHAKESSTEKLPLEERSRRRAYELYVLRGNQSGSELDGWLPAEEEISRGHFPLSYLFSWLSAAGAIHGLEDGLCEGSQRAATAARRGAGDAVWADV